MKAVLMSIKPKWCEKIFSGEKTIEVRKTAPKLKPPYKVYVYCTNSRFDITDIDDLTSKSVRVVSEGRGKVIGEFVCDEKHDIQFTGASYLINNDISLTNGIAKQSCLWFDDMFSYLGVKGGAALHITAPKLYDTPKELSEFRKPDVWYTTETDNTSVLVHETGGTITRPPQSWMYAEEIEE